MVMNMNDEVNAEGPWTREDVGRVIPKRVTPNGTYLDEPIVEVHCSVCGASFIGPAREAGGFIGGHECLHNWQLNRMLEGSGGLTE